MNRLNFVLISFSRVAASVCFRIFNPCNNSNAHLKSSSILAFPRPNSIALFSDHSLMLFLLQSKSIRPMPWDETSAKDANAAVNPVPVNKEKCSLWKIAVSQGSILFRRKSILDSSISLELNESMSLFIFRMFSAHQSISAIMLYFNISKNAFVSIQAIPLL